jgi:hypothetical protein
MGTNNAFSERSSHPSSIGSLSQPQFVLTVDSTHSKSLGESTEVAIDLRGQTFVNIITSRLKPY